MEPLSCHPKWKLREKNQVPKNQEKYREQHKAVSQKSNIEIGMCRKTHRHEKKETLGKQGVR